jgi:hypothetical protein
MKPSHPSHSPWESTQDVDSHITHRTTTTTLYDAGLPGEDMKIESIRQTCVDKFQNSFEAVVGDSLASQRLVPLEALGWADQKMRSQPLRSSLRVKIGSAFF